MTACDPDPVLPPIPADIMRVKETVKDEEELIKLRKGRRERLINQHRKAALLFFLFLLPDMYLEAHYAGLR